MQVTLFVAHAHNSTILISQAVNVNLVLILLHVSHVQVQTLGLVLLAILAFSCLSIKPALTAVPAQAIASVAALKLHALTLLIPDMLS